MFLYIFVCRERKYGDQFRPQDFGESSRFRPPESETRIFERYDFECGFSQEINLTLLQATF